MTFAMKKNGRYEAGPTPHGTWEIRVLDKDGTWVLVVWVDESSGLDEHWGASNPGLFYKEGYAKVFP